jgi:hypothetical protein
MADDEPVMKELSDLLQQVADEIARLTYAQEMKDATDKILAQLGRPPAPLADFLREVGPFADAIEDLGVKAGIIEHHPREIGTKNPGSGLSPGDLIVLILVALLLMRHGGGANPTAIGEAVESNQLQIVAIVIALAAYLKKGE